MATKNRSKSGRAAVGRKTKPAAKPKRAPKAATSTKAAKASAAKRTTAAKPTRAAAKPTRAAASSTRTAAVASKELAALKSRFQRERAALEKNLTEAVREIGVLRHHEMRAMQLERQVKERDELIGRLQQQLEELQRRSVEPTYEREVQQSFALVTPAHDDVDEFEEPQLVDEAQLEDEEA